MAPGILALVPIRSFHSGKSRLSDRLDGDERRDLVESLAEGVLSVLGELTAVDVAVVTSDDRVARWCRDRRIVVLAPPLPGLNEAARFGLDEAADRGYHHVVVVHADLAYPRPLAEFVDAVAEGEADTCWIVPDADRDGTNVMAVPTAAAERFEFAYGAGSFARHVGMAGAAELPVRIWTDERLAVDVDTGADLTHVRR